MLMRLGLTTLIFSLICIAGTSTYAEDPYSDRPDMYPAEAFAQCIEGYVKLALTIDKQGKVLKADIIESEPGETFDANAVKEALTWTLPAEIVPVDQDSSTVITTINFVIEEHNRCV